jgi:FkbM family methyltransferase
MGKKNIRKNRSRHNYYLKHDEAFLQHADLSFFKKDIISGSLDSENTFIIKILKTSPADSIFLDVGAFDGNTSISIARELKRDRPDISILSFEPNKINAEKILKTKKKENLNIKVFKTAVSSKKKIVFKGKDEKAGTTYLNQAPDNSPINKCEADSLDNILSQEGIDKTFFIKIDTEGHEPEVLKGARSILENNKHLLIESWNDEHFHKRIKKNLSYSHNENILKHTNNYLPIQKRGKDIYFKHKSIIP